MKINKKELKDIVKIISFILVFALMIEGLSLTVFSKSKATGYKNKYSEGYAYKNEPDQSLQIVGIGNSDLYSGFVPTYLFENYGYTSTISSSPRQSVNKSYDILADVLKKQQPDIVMIETDMLYEKALRKNKAEQKIDMNIMFEYLKPELLQETLEEHLTIFTFHDKWKHIGLKASNKKQINHHGYKYSDNVYHLKQKEYMIKCSESEEISKVSLTYLEKMIKLCDSKNIKVILTEMPSINSWNYERHNAVRAVAEEYNVDFVDLNLHTKDINLEFDKDFRDKGNHLNYNGAKKATAFLGEYIKNHFNLSDRRKNKKFSYWHDSCKEFNKEVKKKTPQKS